MTMDLYVQIYSSRVRGKSSFDPCVRLRDPVTRFLPSSFFLKQLYLAPFPQVKAILHMASYLQRYLIMKSSFLVVSGVNDTAGHKSDLWLTLIFLFGCCRFSVLYSAIWSVDKNPVNMARFGYPGGRYQ
jgi:hypothetical protein